MRLYCPLHEPYTVSAFVGCGKIGPVSQPGPVRHSSACPLLSGKLGTITVELSCCAPYRR